MIVIGGDKIQTVTVPKMRALYFFHYNFCRQHKTLRTSPAQAAGVRDELLTMEHLCAIMDAANPPKPRGLYKKQPA